MTHEHQHEKCDHECHACPCCEGTCGHHHHHHHHHENESFHQQLIQMADDAWMEVLKEKIKDQIRTANGKNLDELAKLVSEANHARWKHKMETQNTVQDYRDKLAAFFKR